MHLLIWLGALAGFYATSRMSPGKALLWLYIPVLLIFPDTFHAITPGLPDPSLNVAVMMPLFFYTLSRYGRFWRPSVADVLVISIACAMGYSEYLAAGYSEAQNLLAGTLFQIIGPYMVARLVVDREGLHVALARKIVIILFGIALIGLFEFRFGWNPFLVLPEKIFRGQGLGWVTTFRHGFARVAGPYAHCILAGMMMMMGYRLHRWLEWNGHWEPNFRKLPSSPLSKAQIITIGLFLGMVTTIARGPWLGGILAAIIMFAAGRKNRKKALIMTLSLLVIVAVPGYIAFQSYLDVKPGAVMTMSQETAMYRKVLFEKYYSIAVDHAWFGWGRNTWPRIPGMPSIDNYYLLLSLMHGVFTTVLFLSLLLWMTARLFMKGLKEPDGMHSLAFTFMAIIVGFVVSIVTVYLGENVVPALFLLLGWAEGYMHGRGVVDEKNGAETQLVKAPFRFKRVIR